IRRGWIEASTNPATLEHQVLRFLGTTSLDKHFTLPYAAAKGNSYAEQLTPLQEVWLARAFQIAPTVPVTGKYGVGRCAAAIEGLRPLLRSEQEARHVPRILGEAGIRFFVLQQLPGSKMDGVTFWLNDTAPVIAMSLRLDRIDNFWFVVMHEMKHVANQDG